MCWEPGDLAPRRVREWRVLLVVLLVVPSVRNADAQEHEQEQEQEVAA
jgi:hypothetical protein